MADGGFRPATEGAGNEILKAVNEIYGKLTGEEEDAHPHTLPEADGEDNKGIWLTEETARKIVESLSILASKIDDRKDNTFTVNQNGTSTEYNTYAAKSISVPVPSAAGEEGQALVTGEDGETSEWSNKIGGVTLEDGDISADDITASGGIEAQGGITVSGGDLEVSKGTITASGKVTAGSGLEVTGGITASGSISAGGGISAGDSIIIGNESDQETIITGESIDVDNINTDAIIAEKSFKVGQRTDEESKEEIYTLNVDNTGSITINGTKFSVDVDGNITISGTLTTSDKNFTVNTDGKVTTTGGLSKSLTITLNGSATSYNGSSDTDKRVAFYAPTLSGSSGQYLQSNGSSTDDPTPTWMTPVGSTQATSDFNAIFNGV